MRYFDDGRIGISLETTGEIMRILPKPADGPMPDYIGSGALLHLSDRVAKIAGLCVPGGHLSIRHMALIAKVLREDGYGVLYVERADGGIVPLAEMMTEGDFAGTYRLDLEAAERRAERRYGAL